MQRLLAVAALVLASGPCPAQQIDGNELLESCEGSDPVTQGFCLGYIIGAIENQHWGTLVTLKRLGGTPDSIERTNDLIGNLLAYCVPPNASNKQLRDVASDYLIRNPQIRHESARTLLWYALIEAFPCEDSS